MQHSDSEADFYSRCGFIGELSLINNDPGMIFSCASKSVSRLSAVGVYTTGGRNISTDVLMSIISHLGVLFYPTTIVSPDAYGSSSALRWKEDIAPTHSEKRTWQVVIEDRGASDCRHKVRHLGLSD